MAKEKKPSIYSDRGTIGSSDELDEYGVWVKSEPQDLSLEGSDTPELDVDLSSDEDMDFTIPEIEELPDLDSLDEKSMDDLSITEMPADDFAIPDMGSDNDDEKETELPSDDSGSDDFGLGDITEEAGFDSLDIPDLEESPDSGGLDDSLALTGLEDSELGGDLEFPEIDVKDQENVSEDAGSPAAESGDEFPDISIDTSIDDLMEDSMNDLVENIDLETDPLSDTSTESDPGAVSEADAPLDLDLGAVTETDALPDEPLELDLGAVSETDALPDAPLDLDSGAGNEEDIPSAVSVQAETTALKAASSSSPDLSTQLLMKIADELSSIRAELSSLKKEFSGVRASAPEPEERGFFDKEDDEKISLTGDELNNILNTADFTEETGTDVTMGLSDDVAGDSGSLTGLDMESDTAGTNLDAAEETPEEQSIPENQDLTDLPSDQSTAGIESSENIELPEDIELSENVELPGDIELSEDAELPGDIELSEDIELPGDIELSEDVELPHDIELSEDAELPGGIELSEDIELPGGIELSEDAISGISTEEAKGEESEPVTHALTTDDTNYLAKVPAEEGVSIDLEEAVIDEPDLSPDLQENQVEESLPEDFSIDLDDIEEPGDLDISTDELGDLDISTEELGNLDIAAEESAAEEPVNLDITAEEPGDLDIAEESVADEPEADSFSADDLSILELGTDDFNIPEPVLEELASEPAEEEPVSEEDIEIPAAEEKPEEDFGILVVDEPSGEIKKEAEELREEKGEKAVSADAEEISGIPRQLKQELKTVLSYMDQLLLALPDEKIEEFARSEHFGTYKKLFKELGLD